MEASSPSSPEFEFWVVDNRPSSPNHQLLSADELFVDGVLLPLHHLPGLDPKPEPELSSFSSFSATFSSAASISSAAAAPSSASKRWKDFFKPSGDRKPDDKERKKDRKTTARGVAELNINIWPFSRSRSAGNTGRPRPAAAASGRKSSSAPCSRSNSRGESSKPTTATTSAAATTTTPRKWAASPGRAGLSGGVHVGRTSPVWQLRPAAGRVTADKSKAHRKTSGGGAARVLSLNVNTCIGYRTPVSCRCNGNVRVATAGAGDHRASAGNVSHFNIRTLFSKKVY